jgi:hypothetical protein
LPTLLNKIILFADTTYTNTDETIQENKIYPNLDALDYHKHDATKLPAIALSNHHQQQNNLFYSNWIELHAKSQVNSQSNYLLGFHGEFD